MRAAFFFSFERHLIDLLIQVCIIVLEEKKRKYKQQLTITIATPARCPRSRDRSLVAIYIELKNHDFYIFFCFTNTRIKGTAENANMNIEKKIYILSRYYIWFINYSYFRQSGRCRGFFIGKKKGSFFHCHARFFPRFSKLSTRIREGNSRDT